MCGSVRLEYTLTMRIRPRQSNAVRDSVVDAAVDLYVDWREESRTAAAAYEAWAEAQPADRALAFAAYVAALEQEELSARCYAGAIAAVTALLARDARTATERAFESPSSRSPWRPSPVYGGYEPADERT
jgi:hypothetical protein